MIEFKKKPDEISFIKVSNSELDSKQLSTNWIAIEGGRTIKKLTIYLEYLHSCFN
jgi:hypothetical protein